MRMYKNERATNQFSILRECRRGIVASGGKEALRGAHSGSPVGKEVPQLAPACACCPVVISEGCTPDIPAEGSIPRGLFYHPSCYILAKPPRVRLHGPVNSVQGGLASG